MQMTPKTGEKQNNRKNPENTGKTERKKTMRHPAGRKGSYTVEASLLFPIIILLMAYMMSLAIHCCAKTEDTAAATDTLQDLNTEEQFLELQQWKQLESDLLDREE